MMPLRSFALSWRPHSPFLSVSLAILLGFPAAAQEPDAEPPAAGAGAAEPRSPAEWYGAGVRPTEARSPEEERAGFHVPPGFEVQLVAAEPQIAKPLNMAFDARGRLWVTDTVEYPYPAAEGAEARDSVKILEDTNGDGRADRVTTFAEGLNIPIGLLPYGDGAIVFSIPHLWYLRDTTGDGRCDTRERLLGPFDTTRDTHGMVNALRRGEDGWIYACHGFNNQSRVAGEDGNAVQMTSGNTFRFRPDGSRIEHFTYGQVNPFGMTQDRWGNWFTADCHSKPISLLVRGASYPSFGRPHDGLGFQPSMMDHLHGSTAISGLQLYDADHFPAEYRGQLFSGNVMTSRINRNAIDRTGATLEARELSDFLTSDDPWFRPVDIQLGPDGALYVADFYNRIIGHYEVPLEHPGRDRDRGRIWRIVYRGDPEAAETRDEIATADADEALLVQQLGAPNATIRRLARETLIDRGGSSVIERAAEALEDSQPLRRAGALWVLHGTGALETARLVERLRDAEPLVRVHALRVATESGPWSRELREAIVRGLEDDDARVVRAAGEAIARQPAADDVTRITAALDRGAPEDEVLRHGLRIALRDVLADPAVADSIDAAERLRGKEGSWIVDVLPGLHAPQAARWILQHLQQSSQPLEEVFPLVEHAARVAAPEMRGPLVRLVRRRCGDSPQQHRMALLRLREALPGGGAEALRSWAEELAGTWLHQFGEAAEEDIAPVTWIAEGGAPWPRQNRAAADGQNDHLYYSSFPRGETYTGVMRSGAFAAPRSLGFWIVGHNGPPAQNDSGKNRIRLVDSASGAVLREATPPRSDTAAPVRWDLADVQGRPVRLEVIDADAGSAYAWIAVGRFDLPQLRYEDRGTLWDNALDLITSYRLQSLDPPLSALLEGEGLDSVSRLRGAAARAQLRGEPLAQLVAETLLRFRPDPEAAEQLIRSGREGTLVETGQAILRETSETLPREGQRWLAQRMAARQETVAWLLDAIDQGWIAPQLLAEKEIETALESTADAAQRQRVDELRKDFPPEEDDLQTLRADLLLRFHTEGGDVARGSALFTKHCANCHQLAGQGEVVGPQLDGVGGRGPERLLEDILLPDRNVDKAFRTTSLLLDDGTVRVGLIRSEDEDWIELVENDGKAHRIETDAVQARRAGSRSLMPAGQEEALGQQGLLDLLAFLAAKAGNRNRESGIRNPETGIGNPETGIGK